MKNKKDITTLDSFKDEMLGKVGTPDRDSYEQEFEAFKIGVLIRQAREEAKMTQEELAIKVGKKRSYISRIERDASDIRLSSLMTIIQKGFGGRLELNIKI